MNVKNIIVLVFYISPVLQTSDREKLIMNVYHTAMTSSKKSLHQSFPLMPEDVRILQEQQSMVVASEQKKIEIGTDDVLRVKLAQMFLYGHKKHNNINFHDFYHAYPETVESFIEDIQSSSSLHYQAQRYIFDQYTQIPQVDRDLPASREIGYYSIVGAQPFKDDFYDALYDVTMAKERMGNLTRQFIHENYRDIRKKCNPLSQVQIDSKKVVLIPCCAIPLHYKCLLACQSHNVSSCPNAQCQKAENGIHFSKPWNKSFYEQALQVQPLSRKDIPMGTCSLCEDSFASEIPLISLATSRKRRVVNFEHGNKNKK